MKFQWTTPGTYHLHPSRLSSQYLNTKKTKDKEVVTKMKPKKISASLPSFQFFWMNIQIAFQQECYIILITNCQWIPNIRIINQVQNGVLLHRTIDKRKKPFSGRQQADRSGSCSCPFGSTPTSVPLLAQDIKTRVIHHSLAPFTHMNSKIGMQNDKPKFCG